MNVNDSERRDIDNTLRDDLAIADDHHGLGRERSQVGYRIRMADTFGLPDGQVVAMRGGFDG